MPSRGEKRKEQRRRQWPRRAEKRREKIRQLKAGLACNICGESCSVCLDFHHLNPAEKTTEVSNAFYRSIAFAKSEIAKCIVLCANCHRKAHAGLVSVEPQNLIERNVKHGSHDAA